MYLHTMVGTLKLIPAAVHYILILSGLLLCLFPAAAATPSPPPPELHRGVPGNAATP